MPYTFHTEPDSGYNQAIEWEQAFNSADTQIEVYPAVPPGGYDIIRRKADKGTAVSEPLHQVGIYFFSDFFVFVHIVDFYGLSSSLSSLGLLLFLGSFDRLFFIAVTRFGSEDSQYRG